MFNGIINFIGSLIHVNKNYFHILSKLSAKVKIGASIACSGVCLTVVDIVDGSIVFEVSDVTLSCTNLNKWEKGDKVNLEPSLKIGENLDGHFVLGHVDTTVEITELKLLDDGCYKLSVTSPEEFMQYIVYKGSVALDGVSLTVNEVMDNTFSINLLPYTFNNTSFQQNKLGDRLNMEIDILARYINRKLSLYDKDK